MPEGTHLQRPGLDVFEAAQFLGLSVPTVRRYVRTGLLPASKVGPKLLRIDPADLEALVRPVTPSIDAA